MTVAERTLLTNRVNSALADFKANAELNKIYNAWVVYPPFRYPETETEAIKQAVMSAPVSPRAQREYLEGRIKVC